MQTFFVFFIQSISLTFVMFWPEEVAVAISGFTVCTEVQTWKFL